LISKTEGAGVAAETQKDGEAATLLVKMHGQDRLSGDEVKVSLPVGWPGSAKPAR